MSRIMLFIVVLAIATTFVVPQASAGTGNGNTHSFNWFRDADGDGIPNGLDEDWIRPLDGTGYHLGHGFGLLLPGSLLGNIENGKLNRNQYRQRKNGFDMPGDRIRDRKQLRDGTCK